MFRLGKLHFALALAALLTGCAAAPVPRTMTFGGAPESATELLAAHPPQAGRNLTPYFLGESKHLSRHLVWVRDRELEHIHASHDLVVILLRGEGTLWVREREIFMHEGDIAVIPAGTPHYFINTGNQPAAAFAVYSPPSDGTDTVPVPQ